MGLTALREPVRIAATLAVAAAIAGGAVALVGCPLNNCDATVVWLGATSVPPSQVAPGTTAAPYPSQPRVSADGTIWESSPIEGPWIDFPGQVTDVMFPLENDGGPFLGPWATTTAYIGPDPAPDSPGSNFTTASGNPAEFFLVNDDPDAGPDGFNVFNDSCQEYYLRVVITRSAPVSATASDAGVKGDGGDAGDASSD